jgi:hypothetical protein
VQPQASLLILDLYASGAIDTLGEGMAATLKAGLDAAAEAKDYDYIARCSEIVLDGMPKERCAEPLKALRPSLVAVSTDEGLIEIAHRMESLPRESAEFGRLSKLLRYLGKRSMPVLFDRIVAEEQRGFRQFLLTLFIELGEGTVPFLCRHAENPDWHVTRNVVYLLGRLKAEAGVDALDRILKDKNPKVRREVMTALGSIRGAKAEALFERCLDDEDPAIQGLAAEWLGVLGVTRVLPGLVQLMRGDAKRLRRSTEEAIGVIRAIGRLGGRDEIPVLREFASNARGFRIQRPEEIVKTCEEAIVNIQRRLDGAADTVPRGD